MRTYNQITIEEVKVFAYKASYDRLKKAEEKISDHLYKTQSLIFKMGNKYVYKPLEIQNPITYINRLNALKHEHKITREFRDIIIEEIKKRTTPIEANLIRQQMIFK